MTVPRIVSEIVDELGPELRDDRVREIAIDRARERHHLSPAAWTTVQRTLSAIASRPSAAIRPTAAAIAATDG